VSEEPKCEGAAVADPRKRVPENVAGEFFVDSTCIDCDTCRQLAPGVFADAGDHSYVHSQPTAGSSSHRSALHSLLACPTGSIGTLGRNDSKSAIGDFPLPIEDEVFYCGFTSVNSFGGSSYLVRHPEGNWLIDSPKFLPILARRIDGMGGIRTIFLTHRDDVADAERFANRFGSTRIIHRDELGSQPGAEKVLEGWEDTPIGADFLVIPTPGHTAGHCALLYREKYLFTGDHLWWSRERNGLGASRQVCWHSWEQQVDSLRRLLRYRFEWVLPGHGERKRLTADAMRRELSRLLETIDPGR
jgi:glyoxylase-like metal-dependent hydrolase (beta-lactamase superfamily II)/ferredoxin